VTQAVDDAAGKERLRHEMHCNHDDAVHAEEDQVCEHEQHDAGVGVIAVEMAFEPVIGRATPVGAQQLRVAGGGAVQLGSLEQHAAQPEHYRAMRIARPVGVGVVAAVHRHPVFGDRTGTEPQPEAEHVSQGRMEDQSAM